VFLLLNSLGRKLRARRTQMNIKIWSICRRNVNLFIDYSVSFPLVYCIIIIIMWREGIGSSTKVIPLGYLYFMELPWFLNYTFKLTFIVTLWEYSQYIKNATYCMFRSTASLVELWWTTVICKTNDTFA
jgi:hypothetical protein